MAEVAAMTQEEREATLGGIGSARKRKEDVRFVRGKGNYVDDLKLPGMLFGDFVRSQYGHARIRSIDLSKAEALPGVHAVLTAEDLKPLNLHYMPTLAGDLQRPRMRSARATSRDLRARSRCAGACALCCALASATGAGSTSCTNSTGSGADIGKAK
jgi:CO/xanthine dehydrogenase Mo-binding subunit